MPTWEFAAQGIAFRTELADTDDGLRGFEIGGTLSAMICGYIHLSLLVLGFTLLALILISTVETL